MHLRHMTSIFSVLTIRGGSYPFVGFGVLLVAVLWQLISGDLMNLAGRSWVSRDDRPKMFWVVFTAEVVVVLLFLYLGTI